MIAKRSELILESFVIVDSNCSIVVPEEPIEFHPITDTESLPVEIDFRIEKEVDSERYRIIVSLEVNNCADKKNGYSITANGMGFFSFDPNANLNETEKAQFLEMSGLSICITNLRSFVTNLTAYYPWGSFTFHAVDVVAMLKDKKEAEEKEAAN
jgi:preprotein translocase subunit SecB